MSKTIDFIALTIITFLLTFVWSTLVFSKWVVALIFSCAITLGIVISVKYFFGKRNKPYSYDRLALEISVQGSEYLIKLVKNAMQNRQVESGANFILMEDCILISAYKFAPLNINDFTQIFQLASKYNRKQIFVMARGVDRRAYQALQLQDATIKVVKIRAIFNFLQKHNALPALKKQKVKFSFSALLEVMFQRSNTKNYAFSGVILISIAFLTPLKVYYLVLGTITLIFALLTLTPLGKGTFHSSKIFDRLDTEKSNQISIDELLDSDNREDKK